MSGTMLAILAGTMLCAFAAAALAPAPARPVATWVQLLIGLAAPVTFCGLMFLTSAGQREAGAVVMAALALTLATLLWLLRAPADNGPDEEGAGGDDGDGGIGRPGPGRGPGAPDGGLRWDWERFDADFAAYAARSTDRDLIRT